MQVKEYDIVLDIKKYTSVDYIEVVEGDYESNVFNIILRDGKDDYAIGNNNIFIAFNKSDKAVVVQSSLDDDPIVIDGNKVKCTLKSNTISCPGPVIAEVIVKDNDGKRLTSQRFQFSVRKSLLSDSAIESTNEFPLLSQIIVDENERQENEGHRMTAEGQRETNEGTRLNNETERVLDEDRRVQAEGVRISNENARVQAESQRAADFGQALDDFDSNSQSVIDDFVAETERVEAVYPQRLTNVENDLVQHKLDYMEENLNFAELSYYLTLPTGVSNEIDYKNRQIIERTSTIELNGNEAWQSQSTNNQKVLSVYTSVNLLAGGKVTRDGIFLEGFVTGPAGKANIDNVNRILINTALTNIIIDVDKTLLDTHNVAGWRKWLSQNKPKLSYELEDHNIIPFPSRLSTSVSSLIEVYKNFDSQSVLIDRQSALIGRSFISQWEPGGLLVTDGSNYPIQGRVRTPYLKFLKGETITCVNKELLGASIYQYSSSDKSFIKQLTSWTFDTISIDRDCYIKITTGFADGRDLTTTGDSFSVLNESFVVQHNLLNTKAVSNTPYLFGSFNKIYHAEECEDVSPGKEFNLHTSKSTDVYNEYDILLMENQHCVTKNLLGYGSNHFGGSDSELPIYEYVIFNPQSGDRVLQDNSPTILIMTGIHGNEKSTVWSTLQFIKQMLRSFVDNDSLSSMKSNIVFKIIPILNPYGYNNNTRYNARGIDLNRNFSYKWEESNDTNKGDVQYSELETQIIRDWLNENVNALMFIDYHNTGESIDVSYLSTSNNNIKNIYGSVIRRLTDIWKYKYGDNSNNISYGWTTTNSYPGTANEGYHVAGIERSFVLEVAWDYNNIRYTSEVIERGVYLLANMILATLDDYMRSIL